VRATLLILLVSVGCQTSSPTKEDFRRCEEYCQRETGSACHSVIDKILVSQAVSPHTSITTLNSLPDLVYRCQNEPTRQRSEKINPFR
jgi:hypothetical protein